MKKHTTFDEFLNEAKKRKKILVPRRSKEDRSKNKLIADKQRIQKYIKNGSKGDLDLNGSPITSLPDNLKKVGGDLFLSWTQITKLPNDLKVDGNLNLFRTPIKELPDDLKVGGNLDLSGTKLISIPSKLEIRGDIKIGLDLEYPADVRFSRGVLSAFFQNALAWEDDYEEWFEYSWDIKRKEVDSVTYSDMKRNDVIAKFKWPKKVKTIKDFEDVVNNGAPGEWENTF